MADSLALSNLTALVRSEALTPAPCLAGLTRFAHGCIQKGRYRAALLHFYSCCGVGLLKTEVNPISLSILFLALLVIEPGRLLQTHILPKATVLNQLKEIELLPRVGSFPGNGDGFCYDLV